MLSDASDCPEEPEESEESESLEESSCFTRSAKEYERSFSALSIFTVYLLVSYPDFLRVMTRTPSTFLKLQGETPT